MLTGRYHSDPRGRSPGLPAPSERKYLELCPPPMGAGNRYWIDINESIFSCFSPAYDCRLLWLELLNQFAVRCIKKAYSSGGSPAGRYLPILMETVLLENKPPVGRLCADIASEERIFIARITHLPSGDQTREWFLARIGVSYFREEKLKCSAS